MDQYYIIFLNELTLEMSFCNADALEENYFNYSYGKNKHVQS